MHIQLETPTPNTITSYDETQLTVNGAIYQSSVILSRNHIISPWAVHDISRLTQADISPIIELQPEVILIGHQSAGAQLPMDIQQYLSTLRIGVERMSMGAACRTFNVLLSENRLVVAGFVF